MNTRRITYTGLFAALGIILPQAMHMIGGPAIGSVLLPMHIPALIGGMLLGPLSGMIIAMISVTVGALLGMPAMPMAIFMFFEISVYGLVAGLMYKRFKFNVYVSLITAMVAGRLMQMTVIRLFLLLFDAKLPPIFGTVAMFAGSIPGMILQIILVPLLVVILGRYMEQSGGRYGRAV